MNSHCKIWKCLKYNYYYYYYYYYYYNRKMSIVVWITYIYVCQSFERYVSLETLPNVNSEVKPVRLYDELFVIMAYLICVKIVVLLTE